MMKNTAIGQYRLMNQQLSQPAFSNAGDIVHWMGAMQAQDFAGAKWSIGARLPGSTDQDIEKAINDKEIIRTWALRGTWHWVSPADIHWMLRLTAPRVQQKIATSLRQESLDKTKVKKSNDTLVKLLGNGEALTREELAAGLKLQGIKSSNYGIGYLLLNASQEQLICMGPRRGKQFTHVLLDYWVPSSRRYNPEDPLQELAMRYFNSHGPATMKDFMWWAGITAKEAKRALEAVKEKLQEVAIEGESFWLSAQQSVPGKKNAVYLLPGFDEYLLGYTNRTAVIEQGHEHKLAMTANGQFSATLVFGGQVVGTWKRTVSPKTVTVDTAYFRDPPERVTQAVGKAIRQYAKFLGLKAITE